MMTTSKSSSLRKIKYLLSMPVLLCAMLIITVNIKSYGQKEKDTLSFSFIPENDDNAYMFKFIRENAVYPVTAKRNKISATVYVEILSDEYGKVISAKIRRTDIIDHLGKAVLVTGYDPKINPEFDSQSVADIEAELIRVCMLLPKTYRGLDPNGNRCKALFVIPIQFVLSKANDK